MFCLAVWERNDKEREMKEIRFAYNCSGVLVGDLLTSSHENKPLVSVPFEWFRVQDTST